MSVDTFSAGGAANADSLLLLGSSGTGYVELPPQSSMAPAAATSTRVFTNASGDFTLIDDTTSAISLSCSSLTAPRTYTFPDVSDEIVSRTAAQTLTGKTILSGGGNTVDATSIAGFSITGTPTSGQYLKYGGSAWSPQTISATSPVSFTGDTISVQVGSVGGVASFTDPRLTSPQVINVRTGTIGYGEYNSIAAAIASITDASTTKRYMVSVGTGIFNEPDFTLKPYVYLKGFNKISTIVRPLAPGGTLITATSSSSIEELMVFGLGTGIGINVDSCVQCYFGNITARNFTTLMRFSSLTGPTDTLLHEYLFEAPCTYGIVVDGTLANSAFISNVSLSMGRVRCDASTVNGLRFVGPNAKVSANSARSVGASTGIGCYVDDTANVELGNSKITDCATGLFIANVGGGPTCFVRDILFLNNTTLDANIAHPAAVGLIDGIADRNKIYIDPSSGLAVSYVDLVSHANIITGEFFYAPSNDTVLTETGSLIVNSAPVGCYAGGNLAAGPGLDVFVDAGLGYISATSPSNVHYMRKVTWPSSTLTVADNGENYVYVNASGILFAPNVPPQTTNILLARVRTRAGTIEFIDSQLQSNLHPSTRNIIAKRETGGAIYASGSIVTVSPGNKIDVTAGIYYYLNNRFAPAGGVAITFGSYWRDGVGGWTVASGADTILPQWDDGSGVLQAIPPGQWARHLLYIVSDGTNPEYYMYVHGQALFASETAAANDATTVPPNYFTEGVSAIASFTVDDAANVTVRDLRAIRSNTGNGMIATVVAHGALTGLANDDHLQYLRVDGLRAMAGALNMGGFAVANATTYNGITIETHASRHLPNGADPLASAAPLASLSSISTNAAGTANSFARSDHSHAIDLTGFGINTLSGTLGVNKGGTGVTTLTNGGVLVGAGTSPVTTAKAAPSGDFVGTTDAQTMSNKTLQASTTAILGDGAGAGTGTVRFVANGASSTTFSTLAASAIVLTTPSTSDTLVGRNTTDTLTNKSITGGIGGNTVAADLVRGVTVSATAPTAGQVLFATTGTAAQWGDITSITGVLTVAQGGTGVNTLTNNRVLVGAGAALDMSKDAPTGDFVGTSDAQTLSSKTLLAASTTIRGATISDTIAFSPVGATTLASAGPAAISLPSGTRTLVALDTTDTLTNKTLTDPSNDIAAGKLRNVSGVVSIVASSAPTAGQILTATTSTTAIWQTPTGATNVNDATFVIEDNTDTTKTIRFDAGGTPSTGTTIACAQTANRVIALPDANTTLVGTDTVDTLSNKTLTTPVISAITNAGTLTLPATTDTLVGRDTVDTLTNKTLDAASTTIAGTGTVIFTAGGTESCTFATSPTADIVLTFPSATDNIVGDATSATLSNKILDMPTTIIRDGSFRDVVFDATGTASTTLTLTSALTASHALTFPDITDTLVTKNSIDTLTNKTIVGNDITQIVDADRVRSTKIGMIAPVAGQVLIATTTTDAIWGAPSVDIVTGVLPVPNGGTGVADLTSGRVLVGAGTGAVNLTKVAPTGNFVGTSDTQTLSGKTLTSPIIAEIINVGTLSLPIGPETLLGRDTVDTLTNKTLSYTTSDIDVDTVTGVAITGTPVAGNGIYASTPTAAVWGALDLSVSDATTGTLSVPRGGTGAATHTSGNLLTGNGTGAILSTTVIPAGGLVGVTATQTLHNKTLSATSTAIQGVVPGVDLLTFTPTNTNSIAFTGTSAITMPTGTRTLVGRDTTDTLTNKTLNDPTNDVAATRLRVIGGAVTINATSAPAVGQVLVATSASNATWQTINTGSVFDDGSFQIFRTGDPTTTLTFALLGTSGTTAQITTTQTSNIVVSLPNITTTLVGRNTIDVLTNKTLTTPTIASIANGGVLTVPTGTDTLVARNTTDTLTNKTITSATNTVAAQQLHNTTGVVTVSASAAPTAGQALVASSATDAAWTTLTLGSLSGVLTVPNGGTGVSSLTSGGVLVGNGVGSVDTTKAAPAGDFVGTTDTQTLSSKTLTAPTISTIVNIGTLTLPTATTTLVGRTTTDTLTNKTLTQPTISTINNGGILTLPTGPDTLVGLATVDTFTNKTITSTTNTVAAQQLHNTTGVVTVSASAAPTAGQTLVASSATAAAWGNLVITDLSGTLPVANGGTGLTTLTTGSVLIGAGTSPVNLTKAAPSGDFVGTTDTQTLSGKTLTAPTISTIVNGGTLTLPTGAQTLVGRTTTDTLTNKTLTAPVISTIVNGGTLTLPTGPDTVVARDTVDTLTNKTLTLPVISAISNVGTLTLPTSSDTLVGRITTDTLTNKTIVSTTNLVAAQRLHTATGNVSVSASAAPVAGQVLVASSATVAAWSDVPVSTVTGTLSAANGGTGVADLTTGRVLVGAGTGPVNLTKAAPAGDFVGTNDTQTLSGKTLTSPVISTIANTGTLTLPTTTDTLVGRATTDTLTNKTLTQPTISTINNGGILTLPTGPQTIVGRTTTDTLTNKTLTAPVISTIVNTGTLTLPTTTDTLVGRATTDTLTNKTLTLPVISAITNTGTLTLPTTTDTLVGRNTTDTLTNKTMSHLTNTVSALQMRGVDVPIVAPLAGQILTATSATTTVWGTGSSPSGFKYALSDSVGSTNSTSYTRVNGNAATSYIPYPGSVDATLVRIDVIATIAAASSFNLRVQNISSGLTMSTIVCATTGLATYSFSSFSNVPANLSALQIQAQRTGSNTTFTLHGFALVYL